MQQEKLADIKELKREKAKILKNVQKEKYALLVLESPWWKPGEQPKRPSVLPFLQGVEKMHSNCTVYYSQFYDTHGFEKALGDDLSQTIEKHQILYIGAHGNTSTIADGRASVILGKVAKEKHIEGVMVGSCMVGQKLSNLSAALNDGKAKWVFAYNHSVAWMESMLLDTALLNNIFLQGDSGKAMPPDTIITVFAATLRTFHPNAVFGWDENDNDVKLKDIIRLVVRRGPNKQEDVTTKLINEAWPDIMADEA